MVMALASPGAASKRTVEDPASCVTVAATERAGIANAIAAAAMHGAAITLRPRPSISTTSCRKCDRTPGLTIQRKVQQCRFARCIDTPSICVDHRHSPDLASSRSEHLHQLPAYRRPVGVASGCRRAERALRLGGGVPRHPGRPRRGRVARRRRAPRVGGRRGHRGHRPALDLGVHDHVGRAVLDPAAEDVLRLEIETALRRNKALIPVLVEGAAMPPRGELPRSFRPLTDRPGESRSPRVVGARTSWRSPTPSPNGRPASTASRRRPGRIRSRPRGNGRTGASRAAWYMAQGSLVTILGPGANAADRVAPWAHGAASLPDTSELARHLAEWFEIEQCGDDLARVSQYISLSDGRADLCRDAARAARRTPTPRRPRCTASWPPRPSTCASSAARRYQLLVTTSYDDALERAFDEVHEPYDLVVFVGAKGPHRGRFVHVPLRRRSAASAARSRSPTSTSTCPSTTGWS